MVPATRFGVKQQIMRKNWKGKKDDGRSTGENDMMMPREMESVKP